MIEIYSICFFSIANQLYTAKISKYTKKGVDTPFFYLAVLVGLDIIATRMLCRRECLTLF